MKATDMFENTISSHLNSIAAKDSLFAVTLKKTNKNIKDCCTYILNEVKKSGRNGFADEEIFGMAIHYYDEDDLKAGALLKAHVIVNHRVEATKQKVAKATETMKDTPEVKKTAKKSSSVERDLVNQISLF
jgi:hypothetical protein